jgi:HEAT repeat protein
MATERTQQRDHGRDLEQIDAAVASDSWEERLSIVEAIQGLLRDLPTERTVEHLVQVLDRLAADPKWEVRKAVVPVLVDAGRPSARNVLDRLTRDGNQWVRQAAERARRQLARITTPAEKRDKRVRFAFEVVKDLKDKPPEKIYEAALLVGERYYEELAGDTAHELNTYYRDDARGCQSAYIKRRATG